MTDRLKHEQRALSAQSDLLRHYVVACDALGKVADGHRQAGALTLAAEAERLRDEIEALAVGWREG